MKKRIISVLLALCILAGLVPAFVTPALAFFRNRDVMPGSSGIGEGGDTYYIYYGQYNSSPIKWRLLNPSGGNGGTYKNADDEAIDGQNAMLLLSEYLLGSSTAFDADGGSHWSESDLRDWMGSELYGNINSFSSFEKNAVLKTTTTADAAVGGYSSHPYLDACQLSDDTLFALSAAEATTAAYGFSDVALYDDTARVTRVGDASGLLRGWWLRNRFVNTVGYAGVVTHTGYLVSSNSTSNTIYYARPAFNLNTSTVVFNTAADFDKTAAFNQTTGNDSYERCLTLRDGNTGFSASIDAEKYIPGGFVTVNVSSLGTGADYTQLSAVLVSETAGDENVVCYGKIADAQTGKIEFDLPCDLAENDYTLKIFAEEVNEAYATDYASNFAEFDITVEKSYWTDSGVRATSFSQLDATAKTLTITSGAEMALLAYNINNGEDYAGYSITLAGNLNLNAHIWVPAGGQVGSDCPSFSGVFDGGGYTISHMVVICDTAVSDGRYYAGLFGNADGAQIRDFALTGNIYADLTDVPNGSFVGSVAGNALDTVIENVNSRVKIKYIGNDGNVYIGGIAGNLAAIRSESAIKSCSYSGAINITANHGCNDVNIGGIAGYTDTAVIINCAVTGGIKASLPENSKDLNFVGGIVGNANGSGADSGILNSFCLSEINVISSTDDAYVGGIVGGLEDSACNNYFGGSITTSPIVNVGYAFGKEYCSPGDDTLVSFNYYDLSETTPISNYSGDITGYVTGISNADMLLSSRRTNSLVYILNKNIENGELSTVWSGLDASAWYQNGLFGGYPNFTLRVLSVTLDANGGTIAQGKDFTSFIAGTYTFLPVSADITKTNHRFLGWYDITVSPESMKNAIGPDIFTDKVYQARWAAKSTVVLSSSVQSYDIDSSPAYIPAGGNLPGYNTFYYVDGGWVSAPPTTAGTYDIRVTRAEDEFYASFDSGVLAGYFVITEELSPPTGFSGLAAAAGTALILASLLAAGLAVGAVIRKRAKR